MDMSTTKHTETNALRCLTPTNLEWSEKSWASEGQFVVLLIHLVLLCRYAAVNRSEVSQSTIRAWRGMWANYNVDFVGYPARPYNKKDTRWRVEVLFGGFACGSL